MSDTNSTQTPVTPIQTIENDSEKLGMDFLTALASYFKEDIRPHISEPAKAFLESLISDE